MLASSQKQQFLRQTRADKIDFVEGLVWYKLNQTFLFYSPDFGHKAENKRR